MIIKANAKVNLRLEVEKKLDNGYHYLHMINAKVSLCDYLDIKESPINEVKFSIPKLNQMKNNMCLNILNEMTEKYHLDKRYSIYIEKNIPQGAGLGGGSSDAASIINFLDVTHNLHLSLDEKIKIGLKYGADIPYCLIDDVAYVENIGEIITNLDINLTDKLIIIYPDIFISTKDVFESLQTTSKPTNINELKQYLEHKDYNKLFYNDLESSTFKLNKEIKTIKEKLQKYGPTIMSGSGSSMILIPNDNVKLNEIKDEFSKYKVFECTFLKKF